MSEWGRSYHVGDQVIHRVYGLGEIIDLDEKKLSGRARQYYVLQVRDLTIWVPQSERGEHNLRTPAQAKDFKKTIRLLSGPAETLPDDHAKRKAHLLELLKDGALESVCCAVRDLAHYQRDHKLNESDTALLERARTRLVNEWCASLAVPPQQAESGLRKLVGGLGD